MLDEFDPELRTEMEQYLRFSDGRPVEEIIEEEIIDDPGSGTSEGPSQVGSLTWSDGLTRHLLNIYNTTHKKVGRSIPSLKKLYELIAKMLNEQQNANVKPSQVEHKMRNLIKTYKALVDNDSKTGRGKKIFRFEKEMEEIFGLSKRIHPSILLSEKREILPKEPVKPSNNLLCTSEPNEVGEHREMTPSTSNTDLPSTSSILHTPPRANQHVEPPSHTPSRRTPSRRTASSTLRKSPRKRVRGAVRDARLAEIVAMRKERAEFHKQQLEILRKDAEERAGMRMLMEQRNDILQKFLDSYRPDLK